MSNKIQKAIDVFEKPSKHIQCVHKCENGMQFLTYSQDLVAAFEAAIDALEKQIPKKIVITSKKEKIEQGSYVYYKCPNCDYEIGSAFHYPPNEYVREHKFCEKCGQLIDWSGA